MQPTLGNNNVDLSQLAAELALQALLDAYARQEPAAQQLVATELTVGLIDICTRQPAATWQAL